VLDAVDARGGAALDGGQRVGVGDDGETLAVGLVHHGAQLGEAELGLQHVGARRHHPAAGHDLDDGRAPLGPLANRPAQLVLARRLAAHRPAVAAR
jgi:hypothetical protein